MTFKGITTTVDDGVAVITINRPDRANKLQFQTARELLSTFRHVREDRSIYVAVLTGAGDKFFCIGGEQEELTSLDYSSVMPVIGLYEFIDAMPKLVMAAVNGFAVGGGNVPQVVAGELCGRGPFALAALKTAFSGRHTGVAGQARIVHDLLLTAYRNTEESKEMSLSFEGRRAPDRARFNQ